MNFRNYPSRDDSFRGYINQIPFGIKIIMIIFIAATLIDTFYYEMFTYWFEDVPYKVLKQFQLWRLFFTQFIESYFGFILMTFIFCVTIADYEKKMGTVPFVLDFFFKNFMIQVVFLILSLISQTYSIPSRGLWNIYLVYLSLQCYANPDQLRGVWFFPCQLPGKYIPFVYGLIGFVLNQSYDIIAALLFAYIEAKYFNSMMFRPSLSFVKTIENSFLIKSFMMREDFYLMTENIQRNPARVTELPEQEFQGNKFQGQGVAIGGDNINFENIIIDNSVQSQQDNPQ